MKAITICQPYAKLIALGVKRVENRTWQTSHRGQLAIHAGKSLAWWNDPQTRAIVKQAGFTQHHDGLGYALQDPSGHRHPMVFGAIIGLVEVTECVKFGEHQLFVPELDSDPFAFGPWCWLLDQARPAGPFPCPGALSLWEVPARIVLTQ